MELILFYSVRFFGFIVRSFPLGVALKVGHFIGLLAYYFDAKHKALAYSNIKTAFAQTKSPNEIKLITKRLFINYGQNLIELLRMPLLDPEKFSEFVCIEGKENIDKSLKQGKGVILLAMHFGSWEMASTSCALLGYPYKVIVKPQLKYSKLDELLNSYRACGGSVMLSRGLGTRDFIRGLKNNEIIGMVVDQGGRDGILVPFFGRQASMSVGAIRMGLKMGVPLCFSIIIREGGSRHKMIVNKSLSLVNTGDLDKDIVTNLKQVVEIMENYIRQYPAEYMWFYKIWKYSKEAKIAILNDGKMGHYRQSQCVAHQTQKALKERDINSKVVMVRVEFRNKFLSQLFAFLSFLSHPFMHQGRLEVFKYFLTDASYNELMAFKADFIVSCGSSIAGVNNLLAKDHNAKSVVVQRPGLLGFNRFDFLVLPRHDAPKKIDFERFAITQGAPNIIDDEYLESQQNKLLQRYSHLKNSQKIRIGVFLGGESKNIYISEQQIKFLGQQLKEVANEINAEILISTSRRTPKRLEQLLHRLFKKDVLCPLLILANQEQVPEAFGGILGLSDVVIVSGDSISMVSEAASSGKNTIVFSPEEKAKVLKSFKHKSFVDNLNAKGYILSTDVRNLSQTIYNVAKGKMQTRRLRDQETIFEKAKFVI